MEITIRSDVFGLSSTKHLRRNAVLHPDNDLVMMWWLCHLISWWGVGLNTSYLTQRSALSHVSRLTLSGAPKILLYCTEYRQPKAILSSLLAGCMRLPRLQGEAFCAGGDSSFTIPKLLLFIQFWVNRRGDQKLCTKMLEGHGLILGYTWTCEGLRICIRRRILKSRAWRRDLESRAWWHGLKSRAQWRSLKSRSQWRGLKSCARWCGLKSRPQWQGFERSPTT